jgi:hypothetical protein
MSVNRRGAKTIFDHIPKPFRVAAMGEEMSRCLLSLLAKRAKAIFEEEETVCFLKTILDLTT